MELSFSELRAKEVINTQDGRRLGRVCDIVLCYPENKWIGLVVPSGRGFGRKNEIFIGLTNIVKIGEDVILVNIPFPKPPLGKRKGSCNMGGNNYPPRNYEEYE